MTCLFVEALTAAKTRRSSTRTSSSSKSSKYKKSSSSSSSSRRSATSGSRSRSRRPAQSARSGKYRKGSRYRAQKSRPRRAPGQQNPTPDRYREIEEALASRGYLQGKTPGGTWGPESIDALRRFQQDQNLKADGKLDALTIIALGLGPKRDMSAQARPDVPPPTTRTQQP
jgi:hypothetical protein